MLLMKDFFERGYLDWRLNTMFLTLIPKCEGVKTVKDFRPLTSLSGLYKIIAKVLANKQKLVLSFLVPDLQWIQELSLMANELLDSKLKSKKGDLMFKLNFYKAFDRVSRGFLDKLLDKFGFGGKWCS